MKKTLLALAMACLPLSVYANQYVFPANEQSPEQQAEDEKACDTWAAEQVGTSPAEIDQKIAQAQKPTGPTPVPQASAGAGGRGAARGAILGSAIGHATDNNRTEAAAVGAVIGASREKRRSAQVNAQSQAQQQAAITESSIQALKASKDEFFKARATCLQGKGYTVN